MLDNIRPQYIEVGLDPPGRGVMHLDDAVLAAFDPSDRKWIAAAVSCSQLHDETPEIQNAADRDWDRIADHLLGKYRIAVSKIGG